MPFVISTLGQPQDYAIYETIEDGHSVRHREAREPIHIKGGQGVMDAKALITPENGVVTKVTDEEAELLKKHPCFIEHQKNGKVRIVNHNLNVGRIVEKDMEKDDDSAQLTPEDFAGNAAEAEAANSELKINDRKVAGKPKTSRKIK